jgi:hypothetical protein
MNKFNEIDIVRQLSHSLDRFKELTGPKFNFRCPICGDSEKSNSKARGWLSEYKNHYNFHCFNCGESMGLKNFLKTINSPLASEFSIKSFSIHKSKHNLIDKINSPTKKPLYKKIPHKLLISNLKPSHYARTYVSNRKIPSSYYNVLAHTEAFKKFINTIIPNYFESLLYDEPRLLIPFYNKDGALIAIQGRAYDNSKLRYITVKFDDTSNKYFGMDKINFNITSYLLEGPIDSMFIPNSIAMAGSSFDYTSLKPYKNNIVVIYDNEPRNIQIVNQIKTALNNGYKCTIWPNHNIKDINDMITNHIPIEDILKTINQNTFSGMLGLMKLNEWKRT